MVTVNPRLYKPIGIVLLTVALVNLMFLLYPFADSVVVFRRCVGYWIFVIFVGVAIFGVIPITAYVAYAIYWLKRQKLKQQATQMQGPSAPCAPDVIAKKVGIGIGVSVLVLLSLMSVILTIIVAAYHGNSVSIRTAGQFNLVFRGNVTINRDDYLVPHITANSVNDVMFAQAIAHSQDRLFQLDFYKRMAFGNLATMKGSQEAIHSDVFFRTLNLNKTAYETWASLDPSYQASLTAYSDGINHYVNSLRPTQRPFEYKVELHGNFEKGDFWTPQTSLAILKMFQFVMSGNLESELIRFYLATNIKLNITRVMDLVPMARYDAPTTWSAEDLYIPPPLVPDRLAAELQKFEDDQNNAAELQKFFGVNTEEPSSSTSTTKRPSNLADLVSKWEPTHSWLKHGKSFVENTFGTVNWATYSGGDLFEETTLGSSFGFPFRHQAPTFFYLNHLRQLDATTNVATGVEGTGLSIPGVPGLMTGRTLFYTWSVAPMQADVMDFYVLKDVESGVTYEYDGVETNYTLRHEVIKVRDGKTRTIVCRDSVHGPVLSDSWETFTDITERPNSVEGMRMALRWTGFESTDTTIAFFIDSWRQSDYNSFEKAAYKFSVPAMNVFFGDRNGDPAGGFVAVGLVPDRKADHTGLLPVNGAGANFTWDGFKDLTAVNPNVYVSLMVNAGNKIVPPGFDYDLGYDHEESWRFEILKQSIVTQYTVAESNGTSVRPLTADFAKKTMNSKESGLLYGLTPALLETQQRIQAGLVTLTQSSVMKRIESLLGWSGEMSSGSGQGALMLGWYEELTKLGQWESQIEQWHRPQFIVRTLAPLQNQSLDLSDYGYSAQPSADLLARNDERCRKGLVLLYGVSETDAANAAYPCSEYLAASLSAASSKSVGATNRINFRNPMMAETTFKCVCDRILKQTGGGAVSLNSVMPHFQQISYYASIYQNDEHKFRIPLSPDGNQWGKKRYDKYLREISSNENGFWVPMYSSGSGYSVIETLELASA